MRGKQLHYFSTHNDFSEIIEIIEIKFKITYYHCMPNKSNEFPAYETYFEIPNIGINETGFWFFPNQYLIIPKNIALNIREVITSTGELNCSLNQIINPDSVSFHPSGVYEKEKDVLVSGCISTISESQFSLDIYKQMTKEIKKRFKRIGYAYVSPEAHENLKNGWRLVQDAKRRREFDLEIQ